MVNREKVRLMAGMAMYRKKHEQIFRIASFFGYDYIVWHLLLSAVRFTACALLLVVLYAIFNAEAFFYNVNLEGIGDTLKELAVYYLIGLGIYLGISLIFYHVRYTKARNGMLLYSSMLRRFAKKYHLT